ncbi:MAG: septal ring factor EnvC (AmiA/AmiB activator) [Neolewinella sp.]
MSRAIPTYRCLLILGLLFITGLGLNAQSASELKSKRQRLQQELRQTNRQLKATRTRRGAAVGQADLLRQQIEQRRELLETLREEVARSATRLHRDSTVVSSLTDDLGRMSDEYGAALRAANRARLSQGWLAFLMSAKGFNDAFRRTVYLRQYRSYRSRQSRLIHQTQTALSERMALLAEQRIEQDSLLFAEEDQDATLREELAIQTGIVNRLSSSEKKLLATIQRQKQQSSKLQREIRNAISRTVAEDVREARSARKTGNLAPAAAPTGASIGQRKGRLGWPARGTIARRFGTQPHPDVPSVKIQNSGIDIAAGVSAEVEAVFAGNVISSQNIPGLGEIVMVRHGDFYTVYSGLEFVRVKKGDTVQAGDQVGLTKADGSPLHFELWKGKTPLNPERWLGK